MNSRVTTRLIAALLGVACLPSPSFAQLDTVIFGDSASETSHGLVSNQTEIIAGSLGQPARRCLPFASPDVNGGDLTITMAVDPVRRNYVSVKLWGGDDTDNQKGRLYLYVPLNGTNYQVGYRHEGDYMPLSVTAGKAPLPGRFFYSTTMLPLWMTQGKTSLTLKIVSTGRLYPFGSGGPTATSPYQYAMDRASRGIYRAYTHVDAFLDVSAEAQGSAPAITTRPSPGEEMMNPGGAFHTGVTNRITNRLAAATAIANFTTADVAFLARSYSISGLAGYQNQAVLDKVIALIDAFATDYYTNPVTSVYAGGNEGWGGRFGNLGRAIFYLQGQLTPAILDAVVDYGTAGGSKSRRVAWGDMLHASREYGRMNRRTITNQATLADTSLYSANKGLVVLGDSRAFTEPMAQRYLKETAGLQPWLGNDLADTNGNGLPDDGSAKPYGDNYMQITSKGLSREWGYTGAGYGELAYHIADWYRLTGNTEFRDQAAKMVKARAPFRRPAIETSGTANYRCMEVIGLLAWRGAWESDGYYGGYVGYADTANTNEGGKGMLVAAACGDPAVLGYAKQMLADNQFFTYLDDNSIYYNTIEALDSFADYQTVKAAADSGIRLPMTDGQADFVWSDEQSRILALKQGNNRLWISPYWQAKAGTGINGVARFHYSTPDHDQYGVMETSPRFQATTIFTRPNLIDMPERNGYVPPDNPVNAYTGELLPIGLSPANTASNDPYRGKADFYAFRFGRYLIGLNAHDSTSYTLKTPGGFTSAVDLATGSTRSGTITVAPESTVVLDLVSTSVTAPVPLTPLALTATGSSAPSISLAWTASSGAATYTVKRSSTQGGPYTDLAEATGITETSFTDTEVTAGSVYYYVVSAANANGGSEDSMEASASAGVPPPWVDSDVGTVGAAGATSFTNGAFTVNGYGSDIGATADSFHFVYVPMSGDGSITARLGSLYDQTGASKVGLMMRQSLAAGSPNVFARVTGTSMKVTWRSTVNGNTNLGVGDATAIPQWYRLTRTGNTFTASFSSDGNTWTGATDTPVLAMTDPIYVGIAVCSRNTGIVCQASFDGVVIPGIWGTIPPAPTGLNALAGSQSAGLDWTASAGATSYRIKRSTASGGPYALAGTTTTTSFSDTNLINGITYFYVVTALNSIGEGPSSAEVEVTPRLDPPEPPAGLVASSANSLVSLSWLASYGATSYNVKRSTNAAGPFATLAGGNVTGTTFSDTTVVNNTSYHYVVTAVGAGGESASSSVASATPAIVAPVPMSLAAVAGNGRIGLSWAPAPGATGYIVRRATSASGPYSVLVSGLTATSLADTGLTNGSTYFYTVASVNASGESVPSDPIAAIPMTSIMPAPWTNGDIGAVGLSGGASYNNATFTVLGSGTDVWGTADQFHFVSQPTAGNCEIIARVTSLTNTDGWAKAGLMIRKSLDANSAYAFLAVTPTTTNGVRFQYRASAGGAAAEQSSATGNGRNPPEWLRLVVSGTTISAYRSGSTRLPTSWTSMGSVNIPALTGGVYLGLGVTSHKNTAAATANFTNVTVTLATPAAPTELTATAGKTQATLAWTASPGAASYNIKRSTAAGGPYTTIASGITSTTHTNTGLTSGATYHYVVSAVNATGEGGNSAPVSASIPGVPTGLAAIAYGGQITLAWNALPGATGYIVKRATVQGGAYTTIATGVAGTSFTDTTTTPGQSFFYVLAAMKSGAWETYDSAEAYATRDMPAPWLTQDLGSVAIPGTAKYNNGGITLTATGTDIGSNSDSCRIACLPLTGDGTIIARITSQVINNTGGKAGLFMRESLAPDAKEVIAIRQANATARFASRATTGGFMVYGTDQSAIAVPYWFKLARAGNTFTASISSDGTNWTNYGSATISMATTIYAGFAGTSRNTSNLLTASFDNLSITGWTAPPISPANLTATGGNNQIALTWSAAAAATGYNIRRSATSGGPYTLIAGNIPTTSFTDTGRTNGLTYFYVVSSLGAAGESTDSAEAAGTAMSAQQAWRFANFGTIMDAGNAADSADPDGDGKSNLLEYATGSNPLSSNDNPTITFGQSADGLHLTFAFTRIADPTISYIVEAKFDLSEATWTPVWSSTGAANVAGPVLVTDPEIIADHPRRFLRLRLAH